MCKLYEIKMQPLNPAMISLMLPIVYPKLDFLVSLNNDIGFHRIGPMGRFDLVVAMSVCGLVVCPLFIYYILRPIFPHFPKSDVQNVLRFRILGEKS